VELTFDERQGNALFCDATTRTNTIASVALNKPMGRINPVPALSSNGKVTAFFQP